MYADSMSDFATMNHQSYNLGWGSTMLKDTNPKAATPRRRIIRRNRSRSPPPEHHPRPQRSRSRSPRGESKVTLYDISEKSTIAASLTAGTQSAGVQTNSKETEPGQVEPTRLKPHGLVRAPPQLMCLSKQPHGQAELQSVPPATQPYGLEQSTVHSPTLIFKKKPDKPKHSFKAPCVSLVGPDGGACFYASREYIPPSSSTQHTLKTEKKSKDTHDDDGKQQCHVKNCIFPVCSDSIYKMSCLHGRGKLLCLRHFRHEYEYLCMACGGESSEVSRQFSRNATINVDVAATPKLYGPAKLNSPERFCAEHFALAYEHH